MRLHLLSLPHTETTSAHATCAYTQKVVKLARMLNEHYEVILYAGEENEAPCAEHVVCVSKAEQEQWFGPLNEADLDRGGFDWNETSPWWQTFNARCIEGIATRAGERDLLLVIAGWAQKPVIDAFPHLTACEWGVGYEGIATNFRAFESRAWMHHVYGKKGINDGVWYDDVIPNFFDPDDFPHRRIASDSGYLLYVGRVITRKGVHVAMQIADELDRTLVVAGPSTGHGPGYVMAEGTRIASPRLDYIGPIGIKARAQILAGAACLLAPTLYIEPFGGIAVEAMMAGTPAVTTDWGAFTETVNEGVSGYRFRTLAEGCEAVERAERLNARQVQAWAHSRYSLDAVRPLYDRWFNRLDGLWGMGWNAPYRGAQPELLPATLTA